MGGDGFVSDCVVVTQLYLETVAQRREEISEHETLPKHG